MIPEEDYQYIEPEVRELCRTINKFSDTFTYLSCGGHWKIEKHCWASAPINQVWVAFHSTNKQLCHEFRNVKIPKINNRYGFMVNKTRVNELIEELNKYL